MLQREKISSVEFYDLLRRLLSSVREFNKRIDELNWVIESELCAKCNVYKIVHRRRKLSKTRDDLIFSIQELVKDPRDDKISLEKEELAAVFDHDGLVEELKGL